MVHIGEMTLAEYMRKHDLTLAKFAGQIDVSVEAVRRYRLGKRTPRREHMARIKAATGGAVTADDFLAAPANSDVPTRARHKHEGA